MDYFGILKRSWDITWRNKSLWILGFFAVASSTGSGGPSNTARWQESGNTADMAPFTNWVDQNLGLVIVLAVALGVFVLMMLLLGIAARGGLVHLVNESEEGRQVRAGDGWQVGFRLWGRTFMIGFVLGLPIVAVVVIMGMMLFGAGLGLAAGAESASAVAGIGFGGALCCMLPLFLMLIVGLGFLVSVIGELAVRYGVLHDTTFGQAIRKGWDDVWAKRGAAMMWLVMLLPQFAYGAVIAVASLIVLVPVVLLVISGAVVGGVLLAMLLVVLLLVPGAIYNTFYSACWTVFFRRMTGAEVVPAVANGGVGQAYMPPPPTQPAVQGGPEV